MTVGGTADIGCAACTFSNEVVGYMIVTLEEMKQYLRVDFDDDDQLIADFIASAESLCKDVLRTDDDAVLAGAGNGKAAVMFTVAYLYEHREEADHHDLILTLRSLLFGSRKEGF